MIAAYTAVIFVILEIVYIVVGGNKLLISCSTIPSWMLYVWLAVIISDIDSLLWHRYKNIVKHYSVSGGCSFVVGRIVYVFE